MSKSNRNKKKEGEVTNKKGVTLLINKINQQRIEICRLQKLLIILLIVFVISTICFVVKLDSYKSEIESLSSKIENMQPNQKQEIKNILDGINSPIPKPEDIKTQSFSIQEEIETVDNTPTDADVDAVAEQSIEEEINFIDTLDIKKVIDGCATAYDLSIQCCGKPIGHKAYGITASGVDISNKTREEAMAIAVDSDIIPLGSYVYVEFTNEYHTKYNGIYKAVDTGNAVNGNKVDIFMGDFRNRKPADETLEFGIVDCAIYVLNNYEIEDVK